MAVRTASLFVVCAGLMVGAGAHAAKPSTPLPRNSATPPGLLVSQPPGRPPVTVPCRPTTVPPGRAGTVPPGPPDPRPGCQPSLS